MFILWVCQQGMKSKAWNEAGMPKWNGGRNNLGYFTLTILSWLIIYGQI